MIVPTLFNKNKMKNISENIKLRWVLFLMNAPMTVSGRNFLYGVDLLRVKEIVIA
jgi:hypothetical protein